MYETSKLTVEEIVGINTAIDAIGDKENLSATVSYRLGRLKKWAESITKEFNKSKNKAVDLYNKEIVNKKLTDDQRVERRRKLDQELEDLLEQVEEVKIPELKLSDFCDENNKITVPQKFIVALGDLIKDDKETGDYSALTEKVLQNGHG